MLKVVHILSGDLWGGAESMVYLFLKHLRFTSDIECSVIVLNRGKFYDSVKNLSIPVYLFDENTTSFAQILIKLRKFLAFNRPTVIHSHGYKQNILAFFQSFTFSSMRLISTQHSKPNYNSYKPSLKKLTLGLNYKVALKTFDAIVAVSHDIKESLLRFNNLNENRINIIPNGVEPDSSTVFKHSHFPPFCIGTSGRLHPVKDFPFLVEVANEVYQRYPNCIFEIAGDGPEKEKIQNLITKFFLQNNFFLRGFLEDVNSFYQNLYIYVNTSVHEGIPMGILEAMGHGLPIIAFNVGGIKEIVTNAREGYLLDKRNPIEFADKIIELCENQQLRNKMSSCAKERIMTKFSVDNMVNRYINLYNSVI